MTDRDMIHATFLAVTALAQRLTGEKMVLNICLENGNRLKLDSQNMSVEWMSNASQVETV